MSLENLEDKIFELPEFSAIGGQEKSLSFPLLREVGDEKYVVHLVYSHSPAVPSSFVLTPFSTGKPEQKTISEALSALGLTQEDFDRYEVDDTPAEDASGLDIHTADAFYELIKNPDFDRDIYVGYVKSILPYLEPEERKYYMPFV